MSKAEAHQIRAKAKTPPLSSVKFTHCMDLVNLLETHPSIRSIQVFHGIPSLLANQANRQ